MTALVIHYVILFCSLINVLLLLFESFPLTMMMFAILSHLVHYMVLQSFPYFDLSSIPFLSGMLLMVLNHYLAFSFFSSEYHPFSHVLGYFTIILWVTPFCFFISLSANENVLPTTILPHQQHGLDGNHVMHEDEEGSSSRDLISHYMSNLTKKRKIGLLSLLNNAKESLLPVIRSKKSF